MTNGRHFKSKIRANMKKGKKYYSVRVPRDVVEGLNLKKGEKIQFIAKSKDEL